MRVVNLASRPFVNRRPVRRIAAFLWILGAILFVVAVWLYGEYLRGTSINRARLAEIDAEIEAEDEAVSAVANRIQRLDLEERNARVEFLNGLIEKRTFPWSRLFDDLEDVLLDDIYLETVTPKLEEEVDPGAARRRVVTPAEARERARRQRSAEASPEPTERKETAEEPQFVNLGLVGIARDDDALLDFVDVLYSADRFHQPYLSSETRQAGGREVTFDISVDYRLPPTPPPPGIPVVAEASAATAEDAADAAAVAAEASQARVRHGEDESSRVAPPEDGKGPSPSSREPVPTGLSPTDPPTNEPSRSQPSRTRPSRRAVEVPATESRSPDMRSPRSAPPATGARPRSLPVRDPSEAAAASEEAPELTEPAASAARSLRAGESGARPQRRPEP